MQSKLALSINRCFLKPRILPELTCYFQRLRVKVQSEGTKNSILLKVQPKKQKIRFGSKCNLKKQKIRFRTKSNVKQQKIRFHHNGFPRHENSSLGFPQEWKSFLSFSIGMAVAAIMVFHRSENHLPIVFHRKEKFLYASF